MYLDEREKQEIFMESVGALGVFLIFLSVVVFMFAWHFRWIDLGIFSLIILVIGTFLCLVSSVLIKKRKDK